MRLARENEACLDFALSPDLLDAGRINILERWSSREALDAFRGSGPSEEQNDAILCASVEEFDVADTR